MSRRPMLIPFLTALFLMLIPPVPAPAALRTESGYWMLAENGVVYPFGGAVQLGQPGTASGKAIDIEATPTGNGYWVITENATYHYGDAPDLSQPTPLNPGEHVVSLSATPTGKGYWLFTDKGRVFARGDAQFLGDMSGTQLNGPVLDSVGTPSGKGYWMVASDGGVFSFGDAKFYGSMGGTRLNKPVMSLAPDPDGVGYWLVASDGGIFAFQASFYGSMGGTPLNKPVSGMVGQPGGYLMVAGDGGIFAFGTVEFKGSLGSNPPASPVVSVAAIGKPEPGTFPDGQYVVGTDIAAGTYRTKTSTDGCYWERQSGFGGSFDEIIQNDLGNGPRVVTISPSDRGFKSSRCGIWTSHLAAMTTSRTSFGEGIFITNLDFDPGTYRSEATSDCYWARLSGFGGSLGEITANDLGPGPAIVTISSGDAGFESSRCGTWTKIG